MTYRRVRPGPGYRARLRSAVLAAADGDTIVVPGIREAVAAYCETKRHRDDRELCWHYESPWRIYQVLPEWTAALKHAVLDTTGPDVLIESVGAALEPLAGSGLRLADGWFYERDGIQVIVAFWPVDRNDLFGLLRSDCSGGMLVQRCKNHPWEHPLIHMGECPVAIVECD